MSGAPPLSRGTRREHTYGDLDAGNSCTALETGTTYATRACGHEGRPRTFYLMISERSRAPSR
jgi:hypothetical protein